MRRTYWRLARGEKSCLVLSGLFPMMRTAMVRSAELGNGYPVRDNLPWECTDFNPIIPLGIIPGVYPFLKAE